MVAGSSPVGTAISGEITVGCLPALEAGGRRFESYSSDLFDAPFV